MSLDRIPWAKFLKKFEIKWSKLLENLMFNLLMLFFQALSSAMLRHIFGKQWLPLYYNLSLPQSFRFAINVFEQKYSTKSFSLHIWFQNLVGGKQLIHQTQLENPCPFYMFNFERIKCVSEIKTNSPKRIVTTSHYI